MSQAHYPQIGRALNNGDSIREALAEQTPRIAPTDACLDHSAYLGRLLRESNVGQFADLPDSDAWCDLAEGCQVRIGGQLRLEVLSADYPDPAYVAIEWANALELLAKDVKRRANDELAKDIAARTELLRKQLRQRLEHGGLNDA